MQNKTKISMMAIVAILGISTGVYAMNNDAIGNENYVKGSLPNYSLEELSIGATHAIIGEVKTITPIQVERENRNYIFSDVVLSVERDLFGDYNQKEITVRIQGGQLNDLSTVAYDDASFNLNERVLVFVAGPEPESIWKDSYYVAGLTHGKYNLSNEKASQSDFVSSISESDLISQIQSHRGL